MNLEHIISLDPFSWKAVGSALFCGMLVGLERQLRGKPVGVRTASLIVLGTYMFIAASDFVASSASDPSRIIGQVVTGIGFLGAGVMLAREGVVFGVTSAATIWSLAALGVCIAVVSPLLAIKMAFVVVAILYGVDRLEGVSSIFSRGVHQDYRKSRKRSQD